MDASTINILCVIIGCAVGILGAIVAGKKRSEDAGSRNGALAESMGYIKGQLAEINRKLDAQQAQNQEFAERITKVEESTKSAHKRIDTVEERIK